MQYHIYVVGNSLSLSFLSLKFSILILSRKLRRSCPPRISAFHYCFGSWKNKTKALTKAHEEEEDPEERELFYVVVVVIRSHGFDCCGRIPGGLSWYLLFHSLSISFLLFLGQISIYIYFFTIFGSCMDFHLSFSGSQKLGFWW